MCSALNEEQKRAVQTTEKRLLILAGAGSGKTSVLVHRIAHLIEKGVPPSAILGLTFTNKAAKEMRERVAKKVSKEASKAVTLSTFHSFCMQILRKEIHRLGYTREFSLYGEREIKRLVTELARNLLEHEGDLPSLEKSLELISGAKNRGEKELTGSSQITQELFAHLESCMRAYNAVDFDSLLSLTVQLFEQFPDLLETYQEQYRYIMIDEYQDTNPIQYRLASLLSAKYNNLCVVGDDDQSIYGWRGAEIRHILQFSADTTIKLEQNYRSTPTILKAANGLIAHNVERHNKNLWSQKESGEKIQLFCAPSEVEEAEACVHRIIKLCKKENLRWNECAILYRSNLLTQAFEQALMQACWEKNGQWMRGVPYKIFGGTEFYERSEIKDLLAYLRVITNPDDQEALLRIINVPRRGISDKTLDCLTQINRTEGISLFSVLKRFATEKQTLLQERAVHSIAQFVELIEKAQEKFKPQRLKESLEWLIQTIDYTRAIQEEVKSEKMRAFKQENVTQFVTSLDAYEKEENDGSLHQFLMNSTLNQESPFAHKNLSEDRVNLMTFHSAKGLEFPACFLIGLEDHLIPHEKSLSETGVEEERRLLYVAITRAKRFLTLSMAQTRKRMGKSTPSTPSRFLFEIPQELIQISSWKDI